MLIPPGFVLGARLKKLKKQNCMSKNCSQEDCPGLWPHRYAMATLNCSKVSTQEPQGEPSLPTPYCDHLLHSL